MEGRGSRRDMCPRTILQLFMLVGQRDQAFEWLEKAYEQREEILVFLRGVDPTWDSLREDPRFQDLVRRMGFPWGGKDKGSTVGATSRCNLTRGICRLNLGRWGPRAKCYPLPGLMLTVR